MLYIFLYCIFTKQLLCQWMEIAGSERGWGGTEQNTVKKISGCQKFIGVSV